MLTDKSQKNLTNRQLIFEPSCPVQWLNDIIAFRLQLILQLAATLAKVNKRFREDVKFVTGQWVRELSIAVKTYQGRYRHEAKDMWDCLAEAEDAPSRLIYRQPISRLSKIKEGLNALMQ